MTLDRRETPRGHRSTDSKAGSPVPVWALAAAGTGQAQSAGGAGGPGPAPSGASLARLIAEEIIPRLVQTRAATAPRPLREPGAADVEMLARLSLQEDRAALLALCAGWLDAGLPVASLMVDLIAPAARCLGDYWEEDRADFIDVTMAMGRLQQLVLAVAQRHPGCAPDPQTARRALIAPMPGEQHSLGALIVEELFRRAGWDTIGVRAGSAESLVAAVSARPLDMVGLSVSCTRLVPALSGCIAAIRRAARNPGLIVLVGGPVFAAAPDLAEDVGADLCAGDAAAAVRLCESRLAAVRGSSTMLA